MLVCTDAGNQGEFFQVVVRVFKERSRYILRPIKGSCICWNICSAKALTKIVIQKTQTRLKFMRGGTYDGLVNKVCITGMFIGLMSIETIITVVSVF